MSALYAISNCNWRGVDPDFYPRMRDAIHVTPEDLLAMALKAHCTARRAMVPPDGQAWVTDDRPYAIAQDFHECLLHALTELLYLHAHKTGHFIEQEAQP